MKLAASLLLLVLSAYAITAVGASGPIAIACGFLFAGAFCHLFVHTGRG